MSDSVTVWTIAHQVPPSMGFSRQEYWSELPCPPLGDLPDSGIESMFLMSLGLAGGFFTTSTTWEDQFLWEVSSVQFSSVAQLFLTLCDPTNSSTPGLAIHPPTPWVYPNPCPLSWWCHPTSHSLLSPSPSAVNLSQHQGLFKWVSSSHQVDKVLELQLQNQSFQRTPRNYLL